MGLSDLRRSAIELFNSNIRTIPIPECFHKYLLISDATDRTLFEFHFVTGQRSGLIGEDVLDLSKLFIQV